MIQFLPSRAVFVELFGFSVHWYGVLYLLSFLLALSLLPNLQYYRRIFLSRDEWASAVAYAVLGVLIGGRLGYVFFYEPYYFAQHPREIFFVWNGGMASHGGFLGTGIALLIFCWRYKVNVRRFADLLPVPAFLGLGLGRIGNFINEELYGTVTHLPWGMHFTGAEGLRHPIQIYDALLCAVLAGVCFLHLRRPSERPGKTFALFLMLYSVARFLLEFIRDQQYPLLDIGFMNITRGQLPTIPLFLFGLLFWVWFSRGQSESQNEQAR
jgi:phosphatidylglycerol:prolipoprotein diacylglycerol transferase